MVTGNETGKAQHEQLEVFSMMIYKVLKPS